MKAFCVALFAFLFLWLCLHFCFSVVVLSALNVCICHVLHFFFFLILCATFSLEFLLSYMYVLLICSLRSR